MYFQVFKFKRKLKCLQNQILFIANVDFHNFFFFFINAHFSLNCIRLLTICLPLSSGFDKGEGKRNRKFTKRKGF